jgi:alginate O-acetyltransferase complex protein AlgI
MLFTELRFLPFFLVAFLVHWSMGSHRGRKLWLLLCSYAFYAGWDWRFLSLIWISTLVDYLAGRGIHASQDPRVRRAWLLFSLGSNLGILGVFKYLGFFVDSAAQFLEFLGLPISTPSLALVLPVGVSFYTFQTLSYSLDIYRRRLEPSRGLLDLALFVGFFPQLVAGPIVRAQEFMPQLEEPRILGRVDVRACLILFLIGFFKKAVLSDNVSPVADAFFARPGDFSLVAAWSGLAMFSIQLYCDFSGYSDIAIACAGLLGYQLPKNFDFPYLATNLQEFWRRWHITLSSWVHDYLFVSLGGSRGAKLFRYRNTLITMALIGLWHGAAWTFVLFGVYHGLALILYREWRDRTPPSLEPVRWRVCLSTAFTFFAVSLSMLIFRSTDLSNLGEVLGALFTGRGGERGFGATPLLVFAGAGALHWAWSRTDFEPLWRRAPDWGFAAACGILLPLLWFFQNGAVQPFMYFQF